MEVECIACGKKFPLEGAASGDKVTVVCTHCRYRFRIFVPSEVGAETLFQPQVLAEELAEDEEGGKGAGDENGASTIRVGSGTVLLDSKEAASAAQPLETAVRAFLIHAGKPPGEDRLPLTGSRTVLGREGADIVIGDEALSGHHFEVEARGGEFFIRDLDSSNGTFLNGDRIRSAQLADGDKIRAGKSRFTFRLIEVVRWDAHDEPDSSDSG